MAGFRGSGARLDLVVGSDLESALRFGFGFEIEARVPKYVCNKYIVTVILSQNTVQGKRASTLRRITTWVFGLRSMV